MLPHEPKKKSEFNFGYTSESCMAEIGSVKTIKKMEGIQVFDKWFAIITCSYYFGDFFSVHLASMFIQ